MLEVKCPAKINLTLEVLEKRPDGFHNIQSIMQTINLFDKLKIELTTSDKLKINLSGNSKDIPYDEHNLVYKACKLFLDKINQTYTVSVYIDKQIPIAAGLAGGSSDAAGIIFGLNKMLNNPLPQKELHQLCAALGSDLNFCLEGGCKLTTGRGEILHNLDFREFDVSLIKPKNLGISAKEAYTKYSQLKNKEFHNFTEQYINGNYNAIYNDLEIALLKDYPQLRLIKEKYPKSLMSGSGSTFFIFDKEILNISDEYDTFCNLKSIPYGCYSL